MPIPQFIQRRTKLHPELKKSLMKLATAI